MNSPLPQATAVSLCSPTPELTCFGCCPPIRPSHYDCLDYVGSLRRELVENRRLFFERGPVHRPIVGFHCWALGFLDPQGRTVGCLLHPSRHGGRDLRSFIDYGNKCGRESCTPARMFDLLPRRGREFWLPLALGLGPFHFSSPRANPLFHLLLWGPEVLEPMRRLAGRKEWSATELLYHHPFLTDPAWIPQAHRYPFRILLEKAHAMEGTQEPPWLKVTLPRCAHELLRRITSHPEARSGVDERPGDVFTHLLPLNVDYLDFLRLGLGLRKITLQAALKLRETVEASAQSVLAASP